MGKRVSYLRYIGHNAAEPQPSGVSIPNRQPLRHIEPPQVGKLRYGRFGNLRYEFLRSLRKLPLYLCSSVFICGFSVLESRVDSQWPNEKQNATQSQQRQDAIADENGRVSVTTDQPARQRHEKHAAKA